MSGAQPASAPVVSALVVSYRSRVTIDACLDSLAAESRRLPLEVIVVDNASDDGSAEWIRRQHPQATRIESGENRGFAWAVNRAAERACGRYLLLLNPDAELVGGALLELAQRLERDPGAAAAGPRIIGNDGRPELTDGAMSSFSGELRQRLRARLPGAEGRSRRPRRVDWVSGAALLVRADAFHEVGGMDEGFFLYFEDVDLCARLRERGHDIVYWPRAEVRHRRGHSARSASARVELDYRRSQLHFYRKHFGAEAEALLRAYLRLTGKPLPVAETATR